MSIIVRRPPSSVESPSSFLDGRRYTHLRGLSLLTWSETGYRLTLAGSSDAGGGATTSWQTAGTFPCRVDPIGGGEQLVADRISDRSTHEIRLPAETPVTTNDRVEIADRATYEITAARDCTGEWLRVLEVVEVGDTPAAGPFPLLPSPSVLPSPSLFPL